MQIFKFEIVPSFSAKRNFLFEQRLRAIGRSLEVNDIGSDRKRETIF
jgi:hypothetical protein